MVIPMPQIVLLRAHAPLQRNWHEHSFVQQHYWEQGVGGLACALARQQLIFVFLSSVRTARHTG